MNKLLKPLELAIVGFGWVARAAVLALVLMVACNVLLRYAFSWSPVAAQEFEWHLISPIALLGMAYAVYHRADVRVDFIYDRLGPRSQAAIDLASGVFTLAVGAIIAWLIAGTGMYMLARVFQALAERRPDIDAGVYELK